VRLDRIAVRAARAVYGTIIALAVIVVLDDGQTEADEVIVAVLGATIAASMAETYADYLAAVIRQRRHLSRDELRQAATDSALGTLAALATLAPFVAVELGWIETQTAFDVAPWIGLALIGGYSMFANRIAGLPTRRAALITATMIAIGLVLIAIKSLAH
jgi:drug/metabolite transporter (DMT)-like permease